MSGLSGKIRASLCSDQFDLSGYTEARVKELVKEAFSTPLTEQTEMVRFTFIVGGGKLVRSRYHDDLPKWMTTALREIAGYTLDQSAAETLDSQGTFKQQHDTGQNLKYVIVFPRVELKKAATSDEDENSSASTPLTPEAIVRICEANTFTEIIASKTHSWRQRKRVLKLLHTLESEYKAVEAKLFQAQPLTPEEDSFYNSTSLETIASKISWLQDMIKSHVNEGKFTVSEKKEFLEQLEGNILTTQQEIDLCTAAADTEKKDKLIKTLANLIKRRETVTAAAPVRYRLFNSDKIIPLRIKLLSLEALDAKKRSMSLTFADLKLLEEKPSVQESITELETSSRGWFLDDKDFEEMCAIEAAEAERIFNAKNKAPVAAASKSGSSSSRSIAKTKMSSSTINFAAIGRGSAPAKPPAAKKSTSGAKKGGFADAFGGDSDDE